MKKFTLLIDSASTQDHEYNKKHDISVVALSLSDSKNIVYKDDGKEILPEKLFTEIESGNLFNTSCSQMGQFLELVESLLTTSEYVIFIPISHGLSGQYNMAMNVQQEFPGKLFVVKSTSGGFANEYVVKKVHDYISINTNANPNDVVAYAESLYNNVATYFSCEDAEGMSRGGRVTKAIVKIISILKLKPIIVLDTKNHAAGVGKNYEINVKKIIKLIQKDFGAQIKEPGFIEDICVYFGGYDDIKKQFIIETAAKELNFPKEKIVERWVPTCVLVHTRRGAYGLSVACKGTHKPRKFNE